VNKKKEVVAKILKEEDMKYLSSLELLDLICNKSKTIEIKEEFLIPQSGIVIEKGDLVIIYNSILNNLQ
jgi:hypothetical protein